MANLTRYLVWDFWTDTKGCYAVYEKQGEGKLYFSEVLKEKEEIKLLEDKKLRKRLFLRFIKKLFKRKDK
jgi:hypothetical protein